MGFVDLVREDIRINEISWEDHGFNLEQFQTPVRKEPAGDPQVLNQQVRAWLQAVFEKCSNS